MTNKNKNEHEPADQFRIIADNGDFVALVGIRRGRPADSDYWDGNWLEAKLEIRAGRFAGKFPLSIRAEEVAGFFGQTQHLYEHLIGRADFTTMEEQVSLSLVGDGKGHIAVRGEVQDSPGTGNRLAFSMSLDQTMLFSLVADLERVACAHPVRGAPDIDS